jgi:hypothetical protein
MDFLTSDGDRQLIESILLEYTTIPYAHGDIQTEAVFDRNRDRYLLVNIGWDSSKRIHGSLVHVDLVEGKFRIERDGTEHGIAKELVSAGIPKERIVLAFKPLELRRHGEYAPS